MLGKRTLRVLQGGERMKKFMIIMLAGMILVGMATTASATHLRYSVAGSMPPAYTLNFTVQNDTLTDPIQWLSIYFGQTSDGLNFTQTESFSNFIPDSNGVSLPSGWFSYSFEPSAIDNPGIYNSDAIGSGIVSGGSFGGFTVSFTMQPGGTFDRLYYQVGTINQATGDYSTTDTGYTELQGGSSVPEPSTFLLLGAGLGGLIFIRRKMG